MPKTKLFIFTDFDGNQSSSSNKESRFEELNEGLQEILTRNLPITPDITAQIVWNGMIPEERQKDLSEVHDKERRAVPVSSMSDLLKHTLSPVFTPEVRATAPQYAPALAQSTLACQP